MKEDISKLNQLDRIEYLTILNSINIIDNYLTMFFVTLLILFTFTESLLGIGYMIMALAILYFQFKVHSNRCDRLNNEFFTTEIKPKGGSNGKERRS